MKPKYLVIDTETGGFDPLSDSLLSIAGVLWEPMKEPVKLFSFYVKEPKIVLMPEALAVNKIEIQDIIKSGYNPDQAVFEIRSAIREHFGKDDKPMLAGHNIQFDISFLNRLYRMANTEWSSDFSHRSFDTSSILTFLMCGGHIPYGSPKSDFLFEFCGIEVPEEHRHTALGDAIATAQSLNVLIEKFGVKYATTQKEDLEILNHAASIGNVTR